jgi:DMSO reductase anchor subunit
VDLERVEPEHPHWPLVFVLVLTQLAVGAFACLWMLDLFHAAADLTAAAVTGLGIAAVGLAAAPMHLGRPVYAWRALRGLRTSWLSREILGLSLFAGAASVYSAALLFGVPGRGVAGAATTLFGLAGIACSALIYVVRARPAWFSRYTVAEFFSSALLLGPLFVTAMNVSDTPALIWFAVAGGVAQLVTQMLKLLWLSQSEAFELRASARLLSTRLRTPLLVRLSILVLGAILCPPVASNGVAAVAVFAAVLVGEWLGRWLFFVSVVPKMAAASFIRGGVG